MSGPHQNLTFHQHERRMSVRAAQRVTDDVRRHHTPAIRQQLELQVRSVDRHAVVLDPLRFEKQVEDTCPPLSGLRKPQVRANFQRAQESPRTPRDASPGRRDPVQRITWHAPAQSSTHRDNTSTTRVTGRRRRLEGRQDSRTSPIGPNRRLCRRLLPNVHLEHYCRAPRQRELTTRAHGERRRVRGRTLTRVAIIPLPRPVVAP
jgi:hypothetical protein